jgi:hypothetical protein
MWGGAVNTRMVIHVPVYELPRITIPRTWVNKGLKKGVGGENRNRCALRREDVPPP